MRYLIFIAFFLVTVIHQSCSPAKRLTENQHLLRRTSINIENTEINREQLRPFVRQQPNRRFLGVVPLGLMVYQFANRERDSRLNSWIRNTLGEEPVIFNQTLLESSRLQMSMYMHGQGYFNASVVAKFDPSNGKARFSIIGNQPYYIRNIGYRIEDSALASFIYADTANALMKSGQRYSAEILDSERQRISDYLRNEGFFRFSREYIRFEIDSALQKHQLDIMVIIGNQALGVSPNLAATTLPNNFHNRYIIDRVNIYPDFSPLTALTSPLDTTIYALSDSADARKLTFIHRERLHINPRVLSQNILIKPGEIFRVRNVEQTYFNLGGLRNFRFINVQFVDLPTLAQDTLPNAPRRLGANIQLARQPSNAFAIEAVGLNTAGMLGIAGNLSFSNRNFLGGAENLSLRLLGALEASASAFGDRPAGVTPLNTAELGVELRLEVPRLLAPFPAGRVAMDARPRSSIITGVNYRHRPDYTRYIFNVSYGIEWSTNIRERHFLNPIEISSIRVLNDSVLLSRLPQNNPLILSRYKDHLTAGIRYSFIFNTQQIGRDVDFQYFRMNLETSGNLVNLLVRAIGTPTDADGKRTLFKIPYAQFIKADVDFRTYHFFSPNNSLVFRIMGGVGVPYGNSTVLPFIKSFFGGGANSVRAWRLYTLGPGSFSDNQGIRFDRYGDIKLEANLEHRFAIYRFLHGALFADAGNVWFLNNNPDFPGGEFRFDTFLSEIAIGTGVGLRFDFDFFVVRLDAAFPLHNPAHRPGERWLRRFPGLNLWNLNLGIGYPF